MKMEDLFSLFQMYCYLDFNNTARLSSSEILMGFILLADASEKEKIEASFFVCDED